MKKTNIFGAAAATLVASAFMVACGPTLSQQIVGSYVYEDSVEEPETEKEFATKQTKSEIDTFGEDRSYSEDGSIIKYYYIVIPEQDVDVTVKMEFVFHRTGTWSLGFEDGKEWLTITGKDATWELGEYVCPREEIADYSWDLANSILEDLRKDDEENWGEERNYVISSVDENEFVYKAKKETVTLKRIKENQNTEEEKE